jgi:putative oxidoreductase
MNRMVERFEQVQGLVAGWLASPALLLLRIALAVPFLRSGLTKWDGAFNLSAGARYLFTEEFKLHFFWGIYPYPAPLLMAHLAAVGEIVLPVLLIVGLATRLSAAGVLAMTIVIQLTVPDGLVNFHLPWAAMALALAGFGGGTLSADHWVKRAFRSRSAAPLHS